MAADGSIRVETKLDTKGFEKGLKDVYKICNGTKKHLESIAESLNIKTNPIEIINNSQLAKAKKKLEEINAEVEKIQAQTDELLPKAETEEQVVNLLKLEEEQTKNLVAEQNNLNKAISEYEAKQEKIAAEKQQKDDIKSINSDVSGTVAGDDFVSKIKNAEQYEATLEKVKAKMQTIEQKTAKLAAKKGIDGSDALSANREYQKLKKQYDALIASADKFKRSSKGGFNAAADGAKNLGSSMKSVIKTMTKYTLAIFGARSGFYAVKNAIRQVLSDNEKLNNTVTAMKGAFANALAPVIERVVYWLKYAFAYLNLFVKVLTGVDMAAQYNAKAINKQTEATKKNAKATKEANAQLASFDEKNVQSANNQNAADTGTENSAALLDLPDVSGGKFEQICETIKAHINELEMMLAVALLATGFILLAVGQIPMGIACIVAGITLAAAAISGWGWLSAQVQNMITAIMAVAGTAFLVLGIILCASGFKIPVGIAMLAAGAALLIGAAALNWSKLKKIVEENIGAIAAIVAGLVLLVIGMILCCAGVSLPIGIALIAAGAATLVTALALNWEKLSNEVKIVALAITAILSGALIAVGAVVAFSGANLPLGIALMAAGAIGLVTSLTLMWNYLPEKIKGIIQIILGIALAAMLALGIILVATGVGTALGVALIVAGAAGLVSAATLNKDAIVNWISDVWAKIKNFWNAHIGYVFKSEWWSKKFDCIKQGMKNALNGVITVVENTINRVVGALNSFSIKIPNWVPTYGGSSLGFNIPYAHLPRLAKGGIVNNPGRGQAVIAGEAGAEAILPLQNNTEWMDMLVDKVADRVSMNVVNRITIDGKDVNSSNKKYDARFAFATNGGVL
nr:MAG TPA: minor tail protein [Caudoviricetes sp.]